MHPLRASLALVSLATALCAQTVVVDIPDSVIGPLHGQYPIYTGGGLNVIRGQSFCPGTFASLPATPMICTKVGIQLGQSAGPITYTQFVLRAGATTVPALTSTFATNLPDQRVQMDLSGQALTGGANVNIWTEFALQFPFYWQPGQGVVIDFVTQSAIAGQWLNTTIGTGVARCISTNYTGGPSGSAIASGGLKFRMVFEPVGLTQWGTGCPGTGNITPTIGSTGQSSLGSLNYFVTLANALGASPAVFLFGRSASFDIGGGCRVYNDLVFIGATVTTGAGPGNGTALFPLFIPNDPSLLAAVFDVQWGILDTASPAFVPLAMTAGGKVVVY
jgi:hypothetical protein